MNVQVVPIIQRDAKLWINQNHRHLRAPRGDLYRTSLHVDGSIAAVGIAGRPKSRHIDNGTTAEILRIASTAPVKANACSRLYARLVRAGRELGYLRFVSYTLLEEPGTSLRAFGFEDDGLTEGGEWTRPSRTRGATENGGPKRRWIFPPRALGLWDDVAPGRKI